MSRLSRVLKLVSLGCLLVMFTGGSVALGALEEPEPLAGSRELRPDYVSTWYIYNDDNLNGILDPGDTSLETFENWWTPVSSHSQLNHEAGPYGAFTYSPGDDIGSSPMNFATVTNPGTDFYWLERETSTINFYMTYSQFDNNDWGTYVYAPGDANKQAILADRHLERNGWAMGYVIGDYPKDGNGDYVYGDQTPANHVEMDIYVHNGQGLAGSSLAANGIAQDSRSNPQVSASNDIDDRAIDTVSTTSQRHPTQYDNGTKDYSWAANDFRMTQNGLDANDLADIVDSMEVKELDPFGAELNAAALVPGRTPEAIKNGLATKDHLGNDYLYLDAFVNRSDGVIGATDGGVIGGLSGYDNYDPIQNNWGDQQVIRIDISPETLLLDPDDPNKGNIDKIVFWDFGASTPGAPGTEQTAPRKIEFFVDQITGMLFFLNPAGQRFDFPENRIYIARVDMIPEPATMTMLLSAAAAVLLRRRKKTRI